MIPLFISNLGNLISTVGPAVAKFASNLLTKIPTIVKTGLVVAEAISKIVQVVAETKGLSPQNENVAELGAKTMQEGTRPKMEDESMTEYLDYLRNEISIDKKKLEEMSDEDKIKCNAVGTSMLSEALTESENVVISPTFLVEMEKMKMTGEQISKYIDAFNKNGIDSLDALTKYLRGQLNEKMSEEVGDIMKSVEMELNPTASKGDILVTIHDMKNSLND